MRRFLLLLSFPLLLSCYTQAQSITLVDQYLLNAEYDKALQQIDLALQKTSDSHTVALLQNKKAEALIRLGKLDQAEKYLRVYTLRLHRDFNRL